MQIYDIRPPIKKKATAVREISLRYLRFLEEFLKHSRYGAPIAIVVFLLLAGTFISALTVPEIKTIRALPQTANSDWQSADNVKTVDLKELAQFPEFSRLNSAYAYEEFSELNISASTSSDKSATSSENQSSSLPTLESSTSSFSTTSFIESPRRENFFVRLFKKFIFGVKAQEAPADSNDAASAPPTEPTAPIETPSPESSADISVEPPT